MVSRQHHTRPGVNDLGEFRSLCREALDAVSDYHADLSARGRNPGFTPEEVRALFAERLFGESKSNGELLADWRGRAVPLLTAIDGLSEFLSQNLCLAEHLHDLVREHPDFEVLHEPTLCFYCFRHVPHGLTERQEEPVVQTLLDRLNQEIVKAVRRDGLGLIKTTRISGRVALRLSLCSQRATEADMDAAFEAVARWGRLLTKSHPFSYEKPTEMEVLG